MDWWHSQNCRVSGLLTASDWMAWRQLGEAMFSTGRLIAEMMMVDHHHITRHPLQQSLAVNWWYFSRSLAITEACPILQITLGLSLPKEGWWWMDLLFIYLRFTNLFTRVNSRSPPSSHYSYQHNCKYNKSLGINNTSISKQKIVFSQYFLNLTIYNNKNVGI